MKDGTSRAIMHVVTRAWRFQELIGLGVFIISIFPYCVLTSYNGGKLIQKRDLSSTINVTNGTANDGYDVTEGKEAWKEILLERWKNTDHFEKNSKLEPTFCYDKNKHDNNDTYEGHFFCPGESVSIDMVECCGETESQYCCKSKDKGIIVTSEDIIWGLSVAGGMILGISLCLVIYCCCCQRRKEIHSGKLLWIRRGKKKEIYIDDEPDKPEHADTELIGFVEKTDSPIGGSYEKLNIVNDNTSRPSDASGQAIEVPVINIQASTPDQ